MKKQIKCTNCLDAASGILAGSFEVQENKEHMTVPGQSLSIPEVLDRFARGVFDPIGKDPIYDGINDFDGDDPTRRSGFTLVDATALQAEIDQRKAKAEADKRDEAQRAEAERIEAEKQKAKSGADAKPEIVISDREAVEGKKE